MLWIMLTVRLGVKVRVFHLGDYRRRVLGSKGLPEDYFWPKATDETMQLRRQIMETCRSDLLNFFDVEKGQVRDLNPLSLLFPSLFLLISHYSTQRGSFLLLTLTW